MVNLLEIAQAWYSVANHTPEQKALADERLAICDGCEFKKFSELVKMFKCDACGCPLKAKVYSKRGPAACPKGKWPK